MAITDRKPRSDDVRQADRGSQTTLLDKVVQRRLRWLGYVERMAVDRIPHKTLYAEFERETKADQDHTG